MSDEKEVRFYNGHKVIYEDDEVIKTSDTGITMVWPKKIDLKAAKYELQLILEAFCDLAEQIMGEEKKAESEPSHKKPTIDPQK